MTAIRNGIQTQGEKETGKKQPVVWQGGAASRTAVERDDASAGVIDELSDNATIEEYETKGMARVDITEDTYGKKLGDGGIEVVVEADDVEEEEEEEEWVLEFQRGELAEFKELAQTYKVLSDPEKHEIFDQYGDDALKEGMGGGGTGHDPFDILSSFFGGEFEDGGRSRGRRQKRGEDVVHPLEVSLEDIYLSTTKKLSLSQNIIYSKCNGKGSKYGASMKCAGCYGSGVKGNIIQLGPSTIQPMQHACNDCKQTGEAVNDKERCPQCKCDKIRPQSLLIQHISLYWIQPREGEQEGFCQLTEVEEIEKEEGTSNTLIIEEFADVFKEPIALALNIYLIIRTDCKIWKNWLERRLHNESQFRWLTKLMGYEEENCYMQGKVNKAATKILTVRSDSIEKDITWEFYVICAEVPGYTLGGKCVQMGKNLISDYSRIGDMVFARCLFDRLPDKDTVSWNSLIEGYSRRGEGEMAESMFESMTKRDGISRLTMITCYPHNRSYGEALVLFEVITSPRTTPEKVSLATVLSACVSLSTLVVGREIHCYLMHNQLRIGVYIGALRVDTVDEKNSIPEGAEPSLIMAVGMCASTVLLVALVPTGGHIATTTDCDRKTRVFVETFPPKLGIIATVIDPIDHACLKSALEKKEFTALVKERVDKLLMYLYRALNCVSEMEELASSKNNCDVEELEDLLDDSGHLRVLAVLYANKGWSSKALARWQVRARNYTSLLRETGSRDEHQSMSYILTDREIAATEASKILQACNIILQHFGWISGINQILAVNILTSEKREKQLSPADVLVAIEPKKVEIRQRYLRWLIEDHNSSDTQFNTIYTVPLAKSALEILGTEYGLEEALDRFVQFFIKPLRSPDATMREIKAVDSGNNKLDWKENRKLVTILHRKMIKRERRAATKFLTLWNNSSQEEATWEGPSL